MVCAKGSCCWITLTMGTADSDPEARVTKAQGITDLQKAGVLAVTTTDSSDPGSVGS